MAAAHFNRRQLLKGFGASLGVLALRGFEVYADEPFYFTHGIASGDPLADQVILWTRLIPGNGQHAEIDCQWQVARDAAFKQLVSTGSASTSAARDYTVKVDAGGLEPEQPVLLSFSDATESGSAVGRTRTLPEGDVRRDPSRRLSPVPTIPRGTSMPIAIWPRPSMDLVLHLGDYIYEYAEGVYSNEVATDKLGRKVEPSNEILSLEDYRMRYGLYRSDADLQLVHARHPFVCVWDDHELANDCWKEGAENHSADEGDFQARMRRPDRLTMSGCRFAPRIAGDQSAIFRSFKLGNLADLIMLDTRLHGRDQALGLRQRFAHALSLFQLSA